MPVYKQHHSVYTRVMTKTYFIRVPEDMYRAIEFHAKSNQRSINNQAQVILGAGLNRGLVFPEEFPRGQVREENLNDKHLKAMHKPEKSVSMRKPKS